MVLHAKNIPYLVRRGLYWSRANIIAEKGFITLHGLDPELTSGDKRQGFSHTRTFFLRDDDKDVKGEGEWFGKIKVYMKDIATLARFELTDLSLYTTASCRAQNWDQKIVYLYDSLRPSESFNTIYDSMLLQGC